MEDVNFDFFYANEAKTEKPAVALKKINIEKKYFSDKIHNFVQENSKSEEWMNEFFSAETFVLKNKNDDNKKAELLDEIHKKNKKFLQKIKNLTK